MKKLVLIHILFVFCYQQTDGQCQRKPLLEKFTSETCPADYATNMQLKVIADSNQGRMVTIAWHTPIPFASTNPSCPYQQNKTENDWRFKPSPTGYGYKSQNTASTAITNGINSSPTSRIDGQHLWVFGSLNDHTGNFKTTHLNNARAVTSPFCLVMNASWNAQSTALNVSVTITATQNFTASGALRFRLVMTEELHYAIAPGTNTEKDFYNAARASFPNLMSGTPLDTTWLNGDSESFVITCPTPSTVVDKSLLNMVGFIQDDGNRMVLQAEETSRIPLQNDVSLVQLTALPMQCDTMLLSTVTVSNIGSNTISSFKLSTQVDNKPVSVTNYSMTISPGSFIAVQPPLVAALPGAHTYSANIDDVNGQTDPNNAKNSLTHRFHVFSPPTTQRFTEDFKATAFPPPDWQVDNLPTGKDCWKRVSWQGGYANDTGCVRYPFFNIATPGQSDALYMPPFSLQNSTQHSISFDVAYAQYTSSSNDLLKLEISDNCGLSWNTLSSKSGSLLATAVPSLSAFRPDASQWRTEKINLISFNGKANLIMRFVAISDYGNDLFLDNINLETTTGVSKSSISDGVILYPNPASENLTIEFLQSTCAGIQIEVTSIAGHVIYKDRTSPGFNTAKVNTGTWPEGIYLIKAQDGDRSFAGRVVISR